jgi:hypothetical protein
MASRGLSCPTAAKQKRGKKENLSIGPPVWAVPKVEQSFLGETFGKAFQSCYCNNDDVPVAAFVFFLSLQPPTRCFMVRLQPSFSRRHFYEQQKWFCEREDDGLD